MSKELISRYNLTSEREQQTERLPGDKVDREMIQWRLDSSTIH